MGEDSLEIKKSNHYYKGLYQEFIPRAAITPPRLLEVTRASSTVFVSNVRSEHPNAKPKEKKKGNKETPPPH